MKFELFDLFPVVLFIVVLATMRPVIAKEYNNDYLSKENGQQLRGFLAIMILLYHISQKIDGGVLLKGLSTFGYLAVSIFYFLSGYGLQKQFLKSNDYKKRFLLKRLPKIIIPYVIAIILFWILNNNLLGNQYSFKDVLYSLINGHPIVTYSWYIISILLYYIAFWGLMVLVGQDKKRMIFCACVWQLFYMLFCWKMGYSQWWYTDSHLLIIGMIWAIYENKILTLVKKYYFLYFTLSLIILIGLRYIRNQVVLSAIPQLVVNLLIPIFVTICVICFLLKIKINSRILMTFGMLSLEIYILQGLPISGLRNNSIFIQNDFIWISTIVVVTLGLAWIVHVISSKLYEIYRSIIK